MNGKATVNAPAEAQRTTRVWLGDTFHAQRITGAQAKQIVSSGKAEWRSHGKRAYIALTGGEARWLGWKPTTRRNAVGVRNGMAGMEPLRG